MVSFDKALGYTMLRLSIDLALGPGGSGGSRPHKDCSQRSAGKCVQVFACQHGISNVV